MRKMIKTHNQIGIVSVGLYTPAGFETAEDIAAKSGLTPQEVLDLGIVRKCSPAKEDQPV